MAVEVAPGKKGGSARLVRPRFVHDVDELNQNLDLRHNRRAVVKVVQLQGQKKANPTLTHTNTAECARPGRVPNGGGAGRKLAGSWQGAGRKLAGSWRVQVSSGAAVEWSSCRVEKLSSGEAVEWRSDVADVGFGPGCSDHYTTSPLPRPLPLPLPRSLPGSGAGRSFIGVPLRSFSDAWTQRSARTHGIRPCSSLRALPSHFTGADSAAAMPTCAEGQPSDGN
jgi:hypothetical protein